MRAVTGSKSTLPLLVRRSSRYQFGGGHSITRHKDIGLLPILLCRPNRGGARRSITSRQNALCLCLLPRGRSIAGSEEALCLPLRGHTRSKSRTCRQPRTTRGTNCSSWNCRGDVYRKISPVANANTSPSDLSAGTSSYGPGNRIDGTGNGLPNGGTFCGPRVDPRLDPRRKRPPRGYHRDRRPLDWGRSDRLGRRCPPCQFRHSSPSSSPGSLIAPGRLLVSACRFPPGPPGA